jgi:nucleotide-binding universal stress UspA family protein
MRYARDLAANTGSALVTVHAWTPPGGELADRRAPNPLLRQVWQRAAWQRLNDSVEAAFGGPPDGVDMWPVVMRGIPGEVLVHLARRSDDVLVIGAGRRGIWRRLVHGNVVRYCVGHAVCPVLTVPPSPLAEYARRWPAGFAWRHGLNADEALDGADQSGPVI